MEIVVTILCMSVFILGALIFDVSKKVNALSKKIDLFINYSKMVEDLNQVQLNINTMRDQILMRGGGAPQPPKPPNPKKGA